MIVKAIIFGLSSCAIQEGIKNIENGAIFTEHISLASWLFLGGHLACTSMGHSDFQILRAMLFKIFVVGVPGWLIWLSI